jgi:hypothetical protein
MKKTNARQLETSFNIYRVPNQAPRVIYLINPDEQMESTIREWADHKAGHGKWLVQKTACGPYDDVALVLDQDTFRLRIDEVKDLAAKLGFIFSGAVKALKHEVREKYVPDPQMNLF